MVSSDVSDFPQVFGLARIAALDPIDLLSAVVSYAVDLKEEADRRFGRTRGALRRELTCMA